MPVSTHPRGLSSRILDDAAYEAASHGPVNADRDSGLHEEQLSSPDEAGLVQTPATEPTKDPWQPMELEAESFSLYLAALSKIPLLTPEGERVLGREMQLGREAMTQALSGIPAAVHRFLEAYQSAKSNQWELGHVVIPSPQAAERVAEEPPGSAERSFMPIPDQAVVDGLLQTLTAQYASWRNSQPAPGAGSRHQASILQGAMARTFAALPVAPRMLHTLYEIASDLNKRLENIEQRGVGAGGLKVLGIDNGDSAAAESESQWSREPESAPSGEPVGGVQRDLRQLEAAAGTDRGHLRKAYLTASDAYRRYQRAWSRLVEANLRLVIHIARHFVRDGITLPDLVQEGNLGLFRAAEKFDHRLGYRFSTYASFWIRQAVSRALPKQGRLITVPRYMYDHITRLSMLGVDLQQKLVRDPSIEELTDAAGLPANTVLTALAADQRVLSLDTPMDEEHSAGFYDRLADGHQPDPSDSLNAEQVADRVASLLEMLPEREALILRLHYGLGGVRPTTLEHIASILGVTRERVRQLEVHALGTLRTHDAAELLEALTN